MSGRNPFGWHYPPGAEHDPRAPWNQPDAPECPECPTGTLDHDGHCGECNYQAPLPEPGPEYEPEYPE